MVLSVCSQGRRSVWREAHHQRILVQRRGHQSSAAVAPQLGEHDSAQADSAEERGRGGLHPVGVRAEHLVHIGKNLHVIEGRWLGMHKSEGMCLSNMLQTCGNWWRIKWENTLRTDVGSCSWGRGGSYQNCLWMCALFREHWSSSERNSEVNK